MAQPNHGQYNNQPAYGYQPSYQSYQTPAPHSYQGYQAPYPQNTHYAPASYGKQDKKAKKYGKIGQAMGDLFGEGGGGILGGDGGNGGDGGGGGGGDGGGGGGAA